MRTFSYFKEQIKKATTREQLSKISYEAFLQDNVPLDYTLKRDTFSDKIDVLCIERQIELGL